MLEIRYVSQIEEALCSRSEFANLGVSLMVDLPTIMQITKTNKGDNSVSKLVHLGKINLISWVR